MNGNAKPSLLRQGGILLYNHTNKDGELFSVVAFSENGKTEGILTNK